MAAPPRLLVPSLVPLPSNPALAQCLDPCADLGEEAVPGLAPGEIVNVLTGTPDAGDGVPPLVYVVACAPVGAPSSALREGWLRHNAIRLLSEGEVPQVPEAARLSLKETLKRTSLARAVEEWLDPDDDPNSLTLRENDLIQIAAVRGRRGFGWPLVAPARRGWFPLARVRVVDSAAASLVDSEPLELSAGASEALRTVLRAAAQPQPRPWAWEGELPGVVAESASKAEREWQDNLDQAEAIAAMAAASAAAAAGVAPGAGGAAQPSPDEGEGEIDEQSLLLPELPDDCYPLVVCKVGFTKPRGMPQGIALPIKVGDLVRVTSGLEEAMYHGFLEADNQQRGWFPKRNVQLLEDPLNDEAANMPVQLGPPPLPKIPDFLLQQNAPVSAA